MKCQSSGVFLLLLLFFVRSRLQDGVICDLKVEDFRREAGGACCFSCLYFSVVYFPSKLLSVCSGVCKLLHDSVCCDVLLH